MATQAATAHPETVPALSIPTLGYRRTEVVIPRELPQGLDAVVDGVAGRCRRWPGLRWGLRRQARRIDRFANEFTHLSDRRLRDRLDEYRSAVRRHPDTAIETVIEPAMAALREAAERQVGLRPFVVQLMGALALQRGYLAEMATGEGKTLTASLAAIIAGWSGHPCHIVTTNDYLAQRDAEWLRPLYRFAGVSVGFVLGEMEPGARRQGYDQDVTYTTSKEIVADLLRDRLVLGPWQNPARRHVRHLLAPHQPLERHLVMRGLHTAIVDEADCILIDEAVTPLIISRPQENAPLQRACQVANDIAGALRAGVDYRVDTRYRDIELKPSGERRLEAAAKAFPGIWRGPQRRLELVRQALTAREFYLPGVQYVLQDGSVVIVDEFTGRMMPGRTWREGLHQAVEAKEGLDPTPPSETLARISFQRFFRLYAKLAGMTGTAREAAAEFWQIYRLPVISIPTNRPCQRRVRADRVFATAADKWDAVVDTIARLHRDGAPVLAGTRSITASEELARRLRQLDLPFNLLNAVHHAEEARIVAEAGQPGRITIATNMAGRGTDIKLGHGVAETGGLHVIATERHEAGRIDRQLFGRCARQGDAGTVHVFVSLDDELVRRFLPKLLPRGLTAAVRLHQPGSRLAAKGAFAAAQRLAQRQAFKQRQQVLRTDTWIDEALSFTGVNRYS